MYIIPMTIHNENNVMYSNVFYASRCLFINKKTDIKYRSYGSSCYWAKYNVIVIKSEFIYTTRHNIVQYLKNITTSQSFMTLLLWIGKRTKKTYKYLWFTKDCFCFCFLFSNKTYWILERTNKTIQSFFICFVGWSFFLCSE